MDPKSFVYSAVLLLVVASVAVAISRHFGLGSILGLLVTGLIVGPHTPGPFVTTEVEGVRQFTELGVVLLLFLIGLEMKPRRLWDMRRMLFQLGSLQVVLTSLAIAIYFRSFLPTWSLALLVGASFAMSSTAFVLQMLRDQGEIASKHGHVAFSILLMQDVAVVPLLAAIPIFSNTASLSMGPLPLWQRIGEAAGMIAIVTLGGRYLVPRILDYLARRNNREGFFLVAMAAMFIAALMMDHAGMSMGLGAFLMGIMLSTSRYSLQIQATIEPHKGLLMSLFFVAVGMSVDIDALAPHPFEFGMHVLAIIGIKVAVLYGLCLYFGTGQKTALRVAFLLPQGGEFGFVVFGAAKAINLIDDHLFAMGVAVISLTMLLTPLLAKFGDWLALRIFDHSPDDKVPAHIHKHIQEIHPRVVIAGYGRVGHTVGTILTDSGIPFVAFDTDANLVAKWRKERHPVFYGDISNPHILENSSLHGIELAVLTIDNGPAIIKTSSLIRSHRPDIKIVARARDLVICDELNKLGVSKAVPEMLEASLRIAAESLEVLGVSNDDTSSLINGVRGDDYALVRTGPEVDSR